MAGRMYKVTNEEFDLLQKAKKMQNEAHKEQIKFEQLLQLERNAIAINNNRRQLVFKENELAGEIIEKHADFIDGKKQRYMIEGEIELIRQNVKEIEMMNEQIKKQMGDANGGHKADSNTEENTAT